jgi:hypothetical protein
VRRLHAIYDELFAFAVWMSRSHGYSASRQPRVDPVWRQAFKLQKLQSSGLSELRALRDSNMVYAFMDVILSREN